VFVPTTANKVIFERSLDLAGLQIVIIHDLSRPVIEYIIRNWRLGYWYRRLDLFGLSVAKYKVQSLSYSRLRVPVKQKGSVVRSRLPG
jgi:hypothetical protein